MKRIVLFISVFLILSGLSYLLLSYEKDEKIQEYLQAKTRQYQQNYKVLYEEHQTLSNMIYTTRINTKEVIDIFKEAQNPKNRGEAREKLFVHLEDTYALLKRFNIKQLHFHLPNNDSFLRFHRPKKFGDNLSDIRATIKYVNETKKPIDGFEEGRIYNGYRFVFPLFDDKTHIGSVEVSFSTLAMNIEFMHDYDVVSNFLILKSMVDNKIFKEERKNYIPSQVEGFCLEKAMVEHIEKEKDIKLRLPLSQKTKDIIIKSMNNPDTFSIYDEKRKDVMTFIKVQNPISKKIVGIFIVRSGAQYIFNKNKNFYMFVLLVNLVIAVFLILIYKELLYRYSIQEKNEKLRASRREILSFNQTLEDKIKHGLESSRKKDQLMLQQSRLAQMGEMISMIAHQWRQPLGAISATAIDMNMQIELESYDLSDKQERKKCLAYFTNSLDDISTYVVSLTQTIDDFRHFYKENKESEFTSISIPLARTMKIIQATLESEDVIITQSFDEEQHIEMFPNELVQVFLNIIKNAQDNFKEKGIENAKISIVTKNVGSGILIEFCDNGGGVPDDILDKIFNPYFSTKDERNGTGLGLYMSKMIIEEHHKGCLSIDNRDKGACFAILLKRTIDE